MSNREFFLQQCSAEFPRFVSVLEATPADQLGYRPHPRSRSAAELVGHLIGHEQDLGELIETGTINHRVQVPFSNMSEAIATYRESHEELTPKLGALGDGVWEQVSRFLVQGNVIFEAPRRDLAWLLLFDAIHHRGQLSTYLRPMGGTVPSIYGPSADTLAANT